MTRELFWFILAAMAIGFAALLAGGFFLMSFVGGSGPMGLWCHAWGLRGASQGPSSFNVPAVFSGSTVMVMHYRFMPSLLYVRAGTGVTWVNFDSVIHTVDSGTHEAPTALFDSGEMAPGDTFSPVFTEPGVYIYHCDPHPYMQGAIIVQS